MCLGVGARMRKMQGILFVVVLPVASIRALIAIDETNVWVIVTI